jgi:hypothetical protein
MGGPTEVDGTAKSGWVGLNHYELPGLFISVPCGPMACETS